MNPAVDMMLLIIIGFIIFFSFLLLGYQVYSLQARKKAVKAQERVIEERNTFLDLLNELRDDIFQAVYSFSSLRDFSRYVSKSEYARAHDTWRACSYSSLYGRAKVNSCLGSARSQ